MPWADLLPYAVAIAAAAVCAGLGQLLRVPGTLLALVLGLAVGRTGLDLVPAADIQRALPGVVLHVAVMLGLLGFRLGEGMLRLPVLEIARRSLPPLGLATVALGAGAWMLPAFFPEAVTGRSFLRFILPLSFVIAVFPLLALRDLRGGPPSDVGNVFLVAIGLVGAVYSFTPPILWSHAGPTEIWRGPVLVLGESGAIGCAAAILFLVLTRNLRLPRWLAASVVLWAAAEATFRLSLWPPFAALGFGVILGRTAERPWKVPHRALFREEPFLLLVALSFAPDLFRESVWLPALLNAVVLVALLLAVRRWIPGGRELVTGPGLLFLGLTLAVRLDGRMSPITRYAVDFALPAWILLRLTMIVIRRRARSPRTSTPPSAGSASPRRRRGSGRA
ncbi:MAG: hypothetical protein HKN12_03915 [Gemmatimonadetes bacterium]|nr:hypothetical protein [Gemmatimonadota bacterium]